MSDVIKKLYIEATSECNLSCPMCSRNCWKDEAPQHMDYALFEKAVAEASQLDSIETVFFGGIGEPLCHPRIIDMICAAKAAGKRVEMITNGTLLTEQTCRNIVSSGLDQLWISVDSVEEEKFEDIRRGASHNSVFDNIKRFNAARLESDRFVRLGTTFVLQKKNVDQLGRLPSFARRYYVNDIKVSNLIPNSEDMAGQTLFTRSLTSYLGAGGNEHAVNIDLPIFDVTEALKEPLYKLVRNHVNFSVMGTPIASRQNYCRFVGEGNVFVRSDGEVCPCMALLHTANTYLYDHPRTIKHASFGNAKHQTLRGIWDSEAYASFRRRVISFDFPPCTACGSCDMMESNEEDCFGNPFPVCGACLWAQGLVQCP